MVTAGVGACNHVLHCRYARFIYSCIVDVQHTSWLMSSLGRGYVREGDKDRDNEEPVDTQGQGDGKREGIKVTGRG